MLNGIAPLLIFHLYPEASSAAAKTLAGIPKVGDFISQNVGIPIPIYLDRRLTGIQLDNENKGIDVDTEFRQSFDPEVPSKYVQKGLNSLVSINMIAQKDSILLTVLLALSDQIFQRVVRQSYGISYLHGPTAIFNGLLHGFSSSVSADDDLYRIVLQISKANGGSTVPQNQVGNAAKQSANIPTPGVNP